MKNTITMVKKIGPMALALPFIVGCGGGGAAFLGSLFGASGTLLASSASAAGGAAAAAAGAGAAGAGATLVNPEPATMLLMGSGMAAMAIFKSRS